MIAMIIHSVSLFKTTYTDLYNSVSTLAHVTCALQLRIRKSDISDGSTDLTSDSLINVTDLFFKCISSVFTIMLQAQLCLQAFYDANDCSHSKMLMFCYSMHLKHLTEYAIMNYLQG